IPDLIASPTTITYGSTSALEEGEVDGYFRELNGMDYTTTYEVSLDDVEPGTFYYKLSIENINGDPVYSPVMTLQIEGEEEEPAEVKAFPSAMGAGAYATGGRGGQVIKVTNLNNSGPGSLRDALLKTFPRIIVFDVSGTINLTSI